MSGWGDREGLARIRAAQTPEVLLTRETLISAIEARLAGSRIALVEGPPMTGKTSIRNLLQRKHKRHAFVSMRNWTEGSYQDYGLDNMVVPSARYKNRTLDDLMGDSSKGWKRLTHIFIDDAECLSITGKEYDAFYRFLVDVPKNHPVEKPGPRIVVFRTLRLDKRLPGSFHALVAFRALQPSDLMFSLAEVKTVYGVLPGKSSSNEHAGIEHLYAMLGGHAGLLSLACEWLTKHVGTYDLSGVKEQMQKTQFWGNLASKARIDMTGIQALERSMRNMIYDVLLVGSASRTGITQQKVNALLDRGILIEGEDNLFVIASEGVRWILQYILCTTAESRPGGGLANDLRSLITLTFQGMSSRQLRLASTLQQKPSMRSQDHIKGRVPAKAGDSSLVLEYAFQQQFSFGQRFLTGRVVSNEVQVKNVDGSVRGRIDFIIKNGDTWVVELLRADPADLTKHFGRFDPNKDARYVEAVTDVNATYVIDIHQGLEDLGELPNWPTDRIPEGVKLARVFLNKAYTHTRLQFGPGDILPVARLPSDPLQYPVVGPTEEEIRQKKIADLNAKIAEAEKERDDVRADKNEAKELMDEAKNEVPTYTNERDKQVMAKKPADPGFDEEAYKEYIKQKGRFDRALDFFEHLRDVTIPKLQEQLSELEDRQALATAGQAVDTAVGTSDNVEPEPESAVHNAEGTRKRSAFNVAPATVRVKRARGRGRGL